MRDCLQSLDPVVLEPCKGLAKRERWRYEALGGSFCSSLWLYGLSGIGGVETSLYGFLPHKGKARSEKFNEFYQVV